MQNDLLLITTPFTQLNTAYPATAFLSGFLNNKGFKVSQFDLGIETFLNIFTPKTISEIFDFVEQNNIKLSAFAKRVFKLKQEYISFIEQVIKFLQDKNNSFAYNICNNILPQTANLENKQYLNLNFGENGIIDKAKYFATLFLEDIGKFIAETVDPYFGFSRYAENICLRVIDFNNLCIDLQKDTIITKLMLSILNEKIKLENPKIIGFSIPFPGNLFTTLKSAKFIKTNFPDIKIVIGGGYVNTELRNLSEIKLFDFVDYVCFDDGELPLLNLLEHILNNKTLENLVRTYIKIENEVKYINNQNFNDFTHSEICTPSYKGLCLENYINTLEMTNPMHRLWNDGKWNKLTLAHGCYWHKCTFCDTSLDYIKRYSKTSASELCDRIQNIVLQTNQNGFHFTDEAAPPAVLKELALEIIKRKIVISWWTNIRFEPTFTKDLCYLLRQSGCVAVSGGLEVASERILKLINKGVTIEQVTEVARNFQQQGILIHAYLMYGFPTQTAKETIDSLEIVRQLFVNNLIQSGYWHRFAMTVHSEIGQNPEKFGVTIIDEPNKTFASNDCLHNDTKGANHQEFSFGLKKALYNFMHKQCLDFELQEWFDFKISRTTINPNFILNLLNTNQNIVDYQNKNIIWLGNIPSFAKGKKDLQKLFFDTKLKSFTIETSDNEATWLINFLNKAKIENNNLINYSNIKTSYETETNLKFSDFIKTKNWKMLKNNGLIII